MSTPAPLKKKVGRPSLGFQRRIERCVMEDDLAMAVEKYREIEGLTLNEAVKALLRMGLAASPRDAALRAEKMRAYAEVRRWTITACYRAVTEVGNMLQESMRQNTIELATAAANEAHGAEPDLSQVQDPNWGFP